MKNAKAVLTLFSIVAIVCGGTLAPGYAEDPAELKAQEPSLDTKAPPEALMLNGSVSKQDVAGNQSAHQAQEQWSFARLGAAHRGKRTSEDYRNLEFGISGLVELRFFFDHPIVIKVFPGCPAEIAGIRPGDHVVSANGHKFSWRDNQHDFWRIMDGRAGTTVDVDILRRGQPMTYRLVRLNIEDIPDPKTRRMFEKMLDSLGPPSP
jgi:C-terminal processing protease CtpA/Prc